jgi:hypothetical protein
LENSIRGRTGLIYFSPRHVNATQEAPLSNKRETAGGKVRFFFCITDSRTRRGFAASGSQTTTKAAPERWISCRAAVTAASQRCSGPLSSAMLSICKDKDVVGAVSRNEYMAASLLSGTSKAGSYDRGGIVPTPFAKRERHDLHWRPPPRNSIGQIRFDNERPWPAPKLR